MAIFGVRTEEVKARGYFNEAKTRLDDKNLLRNPFNGNIFQLRNEEGWDYFLIEMLPIYPKPYILGFVSLGAAYLFGGLSWWLLPGILICCSGIFWSKYFFFLILEINLRKKGCKAQLLSSSQTLQVVRGMLECGARLKINA